MLLLKRPLMIADGVKGLGDEVQVSPTVQAASDTGCQVEDHGYLKASDTHIEQKLN